MLKLVSSLLISTVIIGCGNEFKPVTKIENDFKPIVEKFEQLYNVEVEMDMFYENLEGDVIGICRYENNWSEIAIDPVYWDNSSELDHEQLVFHELAHCVLGQDHRNYMLEDTGCPGSIMDEYHIDNGCYEEYYYYYLEELRSGLNELL